MESYVDRLLRIPTRPQVRSLNLSTSVGVAAYEAMRQWGDSHDQPLIHDA